MISGSFAGNALQLKASYGSSPYTLKKTNTCAKIYCEFGVGEKREIEPDREAERQRG